MHKLFSGIPAAGLPHHLTVDGIPCLVPHSLRRHLTNGDTPMDATVSDAILSEWTVINMRYGNVKTVNGLGERPSSHSWVIIPCNGGADLVGG